MRTHSDSLHVTQHARISVKASPPAFVPQNRAQQATPIPSSPRREQNRARPPVQNRPRCPLFLSLDLMLDLVPVSNLPRPLSISDLSPAPMHGSQLPVVYQEVPGAYSEAAVAKTYLGYNAIPCDQFEVAFQAVE